MAFGVFAGHSRFQDLKAERNLGSQNFRFESGLVDEDGKEFLLGNDGSDGNMWGRLDELNGLIGLIELIGGAGRGRLDQGWTRMDTDSNRRKLRERRSSPKTS